MNTNHFGFVPHLLALTGAIALLTGTARAALTLTINEATANRLSVTLGGTFDATTIGDSPRPLALKADWSTHIGTNVPWIADSLGNNSFSNVPGVIITDTVTMGSVLRSESNVIATSISLHGDSIEWNAKTSIPAGTPVSGTFTMEGTNIFDFTGIHTLQLLSGINSAPHDYARIEASAPLPEPTTALLGTLGLTLLATRRNRCATAR